MSGNSASSQASSPTQLVEAYLAAWNTRRGASVVVALAPGGTYADPLLPGPVSGDDLAGYVGALAQAVPDFSFTAGEILESGDRVTLSWQMTGTQSGPPMPGLPGPTGGVLDLPGVDLIEVGSEGISSVVGYFDQITLLRQLGMDVSIGLAQPDPNALM